MAKQIARRASFIFNMGQWGFLSVMEVQASVMRVLEDVEESPPVTCKWVVCSYQAFELSLLVGSSVWHLPCKYSTYMQMDSHLNSAVIDLLFFPSFLTLRQVMVSCGLLQLMLIFQPRKICWSILTFFRSKAPALWCWGLTLCDRAGSSASQCSQLW